jgi:hypothetical protein
MRLMFVQMLKPPRSDDLDGEQNLDGEPSWSAGSLRAPTVDDYPTSQSNAVVSSKLTFRFSKPDPHEFVKLTHERLLRARVYC